MDTKAVSREDGTAADIGDAEGHRCFAKNDDVSLMAEEQPDRETITEANRATVGSYVPPATTFGVDPLEIDRQESMDVEEGSSSSTSAAQHTESSGKSRDPDIYPSPIGLRRTQ